MTGGARGLGRAIAAGFAAEGASGAVFDLGVDTTPAGWRAMAIDVRDEAALASGFEAVAKEFGRIDIVVANAGVVPPWRRTEDIDLAEWDTVFAINVRGVMATIKHAAPRLREGGAIIVMASMNATRAHPLQCLYTATKHAVLGIVRATALDLGRRGIRVNALAPGPIAIDALLTRMSDRASQGGASVEAALRAASDTALGRMATEVDVARAALFLAKRSFRRHDRRAAAGRWGARMTDLTDRVVLLTGASKGIGAATAARLGAAGAHVIAHYGRDAAGAAAATAAIPDDRKAPAGTADLADSDAVDLLVAARARVARAHRRAGQQCGDHALAWWIRRRG